MALFMVSWVDLLTDLKNMSNFSETSMTYSEIRKIKFIVKEQPNSLFVIAS
jgi:hypothetical protein